MTLFTLFYIRDNAHKIRFSIAIAAINNFKRLEMKGSMAQDTLNTKNPQLSVY